MMERVIWWTLRGLATGGIRLAAKVAPQRELDIFPHRMHAEGRPWWYLDAYMGAPGWLLVKFAGWTVEVSWKTEKELAA